jgi:NADPH:quinone reductase-like Zn-dependent oxidoreductase
MSYPSSYRAFRRSEEPFPLSINLSTETLPQALTAHQVVIRIHAVALNYRDVAMLHKGNYPIPVEHKGIPSSDCAAEVVAIGIGVRKFGIGDRVAPTIGLANLTKEDRDAETLALGGNVPGVLREFAVFEEKVLVKLPQHLSWEEVTRADASFFFYAHC